MDHPPNILYLSFDQLKASATPMQGNPHAHMPFTQEMATRGVHFADAYATSPICTPSRTSVMTGVHPLVHQVTCHQNRAPYNLPQLAELLSDAGYYNAVIGHYEACRNLGRGWHDQVPSDELGTLRKHYQDRLLCGRSDVGWSSGRITTQTAEESHAHVMTDRTFHMLDGIQANDAPFFLHVAYEDPHPPYFVAPPWDTLVNPDDVELPDPGTAAGRPAWQNLAREQLGTAQATEADIRQVIATYHGMAAGVDAQMRRLTQEMQRRGLLENTWIIISSDHGDYTGEKGLFMKSESLYECLLHVPLVIVPPEGADFPRGRRVAGLVDLVDLFPTILSLAGTQVPDYAQGHDLIGWLRHEAHQPLRTLVFSQVGDYHGSLGTTNPGGIPAAGRHPSLLQGGRTLDFSVVRDPDYGDEAYDLRRDPKELHNLLGKNGEPAEVAALRQQVDAWEEECLRLRDALGIAPGYRGFDMEGKAKDLYGYDTRK